MHFLWILTTNFNWQLSTFFRKTSSVCLLIIILNAHHIIANNRGFPYLRKGEGTGTVATRIRNKSWAEEESDQSVEEALRNYNRQGLQRKEILSFLVCDFGDIHCNDKRVSVEDVKSAIINKELMGPGRLLGYHATHLKIKNIHGLNMPRDLVYAAMTGLDSDGLIMRQPGNKKPKEKGTFISSGPNWVMSLDGHGKPMGFQNNTFPIAIYGAIDTASGKLL